MNYVELDLGGKKRGAKLGIGYLRFVTDEKGITLDEFFKTFQEMASGKNLEMLYTVIDLLYKSLLYNCKRKREEPDFDYDDVLEWIDDDGGFNSDVYKVFMESLTLSFGADLGKNQPQKKGAK